MKHITSLAPISAALIAMLALAACQQPTETKPQPSLESFDATLAKHTAAISVRDYQGMVDTITTGDKLMLIFPDGERLQTREEFLAFHRDWFGDPAWSFETELIERSVDGKYGHALYRTDFDPDADGPETPRPSWLTLGFRQEDGQWRLVHDQNTRIEASEGE